MSNFSLKWRPKKFSEIVGQNNVINSIINSFKYNRIHNSYLIYGPYGTGKTSIARLISKGLNCDEYIKSCLNINYNFPCNKCNNCLLMENNKFIDFIEIDASLKTKVEDIRDLLDNINYLPYYGLNKIYLIDEIHTISKLSFSTLLKSLEEPPINTIFILVTTEINKIPNTILSRCFKLNLNKLDNNLIINRLCYISNIEKISFEQNVLYYISDIANGSLRDSLNILEQLSIVSKNNIKLELISNLFNICNLDILINLIEYIIYNDLNKLLIELYNFSLINLDYNFIINKLLIIIHYIFMINFNKNYYLDSIFNNKKNTLIKLSNNISIEKIELFYSLLIELKEKLIYYYNYKIAFEAYIIKIFYNINNKLNK
ncbi:DNA polymerase III subunit gamma/tau [endosymbiont of Pachyrhynchus infernalis]|uniref:DNA polymerase III subunit gamma/tau n=1 Tax=endosymbiont of Pachyrhynchus infernalis TaxID=1971488 RepID=UPI000DC7354D|nr:DNA polymerase III subunit gamma/tau [endosymbiont of Pachyrhynchus infernalis]BBA84922.1 DNA polymerase III subunits gamma and tau [endosymbiont of Pachyrhynchus infernalis]